MPSIVDAEHSPEFEELAGLSALRVLEGDEQARFEQHAARCARCQLIVRLDRQTLGRLGLAAPEMEPSADFKARLLQRAADELAAAAPQAPGAAAPRAPEAVEPQAPGTAVQAPAPEARQPIPPRPRPTNIVSLFRRSPWASALAALFVIGVGTASGGTNMNQVVASYELSGSLGGTARVVVHRSGAAELEMRDVPNPQPGSIYEAWVIPPNRAPIAAGTTSNGQATLPLPGDVRGTTVAITVEARPVDAPTSNPVLATVVQS